MSRRALIAGVARDCGPHLSGVFANLERIASCYDEVAFCFVENDSTDDTQARLAQFGRGRPSFHLFNLDGLGQLPIRTLRLEYARNLYLSFARTHPSVAQFDELVVIDMDDAGGFPLEPDRFRAARARLDQDAGLAGVFANQRGLYYDLWALRAAGWCPDDVWLAMAVACMTPGVDDESAYERVMAPRVRSIDPGAAVIDVDSAFGGLGIYRLSALRASPATYHGAQMHVLPVQNNGLAIVRMQCCEHVSLNLGLRAAGHRLCIDPALINRVMPSSARFPPGAFRGMLF
jgi:hypothetical protein